VRGAQSGEDPPAMRSKGGNDLERSSCVFVVLFVESEGIDSRLVVDTDIYCTGRCCCRKECGYCFLNGMEFGVVYLSSTAEVKFSFS